MAARCYIVCLLRIRVDGGIRYLGSVRHKHTASYAPEGVFARRQRDNVERHGDNRQLQLG